MRAILSSVMICLSLGNRSPGSLEMIVNPNFDAFLIPEDTVINSASTWEHTFYILEIFKNPVPNQMRSTQLEIYDRCITLTSLMNKIISNIENDEGTNLTHVENLVSNLCDDVRPVEADLVIQRASLVSSIDNNIRSIWRFMIQGVEVSKCSTRQHRSAPFNFVSQISEKLFGTGRKEVIDKAIADLKALNQTSATTFGKLYHRIERLESAAQIANKALNHTLNIIETQQEELNISFQLAERKLNQIQHQMTSTQIKVLLLYQIFPFFSKLNSILMQKATTEVNALTMMQQKTSSILSGLQKLSHNHLPIELIDSETLESVLQTIDEALLHVPGDFYIAIRDVRYYYGSLTASFTFHGHLAITILVPLTSSGSTFQSYSIQTVKLPFTHDQELSNHYTQVSQLCPILCNFSGSHLLLGTY